MSKADCERFDFNNTGLTTPELAGQAVAQPNYAADYEKLVQELKLIADQAEKLVAAAKTKSRELQVVDATEGGSSLDLQPDLQAVWDGLCQAWYGLKLQSGQRQAKPRH